MWEFEADAFSRQVSYGYDLLAALSLELTKIDFKTLAKTFPLNWLIFDDLMSNFNVLGIVLIFKLLVA